MPRDVEPLELGEGVRLGRGPDRENSGIVKSRRHADVYWMHNDSGDEPRIYPVRRDGEVHASTRTQQGTGVLSPEAATSLEKPLHSPARI